MKTFNKGSTRDHQELVKKFRTEVSTVFKGEVKTISVTVGMFRAFDDVERIIHSGETGQTDLIVFGKRWYLFFDGKTGKAKFSKEQQLFKNVYDELNGIETVYKLESIEQGITVIRNAKEYYEARFTE